MGKLIPGAGALSFLEELSKATAWSGLGAAFVATVPAIAKPSKNKIPPLVGPNGELAVVKPTSALIDELEEGWPGTWTRHAPVANISASLLALKPGTITYVYKIWDVSVSAVVAWRFTTHVLVCAFQFAEVEALAVALNGSHVQLVDYRAMGNLTRAKQAHAAQQAEVQQ
jgi:hypothetical protein